MSSLRGFSPARVPTEARPRRRGAVCAGLSAWLLAAGCSSVAVPDLQDAEPALSGGTEEFDSSGGQEGGTSGGSGTSGASSDGSSAGGETGGTGDGGVPPPEELPEPQDMLEPLNNDPLMGECGGTDPRVWSLALREQGAMTSPALAREAMMADWPSLDEVSIRPWEFLNYYTFPHPLAPDGLVWPKAQLRAGADDLGDMFELQVALAGPALAEADRPPVHLTLALDNSGAMEGKALALLKSAGAALASQLRPGDTVALATWNEADAILLPVTQVKGANDPVVLAALAGFTAGGATDLQSALKASYGLAEQAYVPTDINRVVVITGGGATATDQDLAEIAARAVDAPGKPGIHLVGVGVGDAALYRRSLIDAVARAGGGTSLFIGSESEATRQLGERFIGALALAALDVHVRLTLPPDLQLGQVSADAKIVEAERVLLAPNDRAVLHRVLRPCGAEVDPSGVIRAEVQWIDAKSGAVKQAAQDWKVGELLAGDTALLAKGAAVLAYAEALRGWKHGDLLPLQTALGRLAEAKAALPNDGELAEIAEVLAALQGL